MKKSASLFMIAMLILATVSSMAPAPKPVLAATPTDPDSYLVEWRNV